MNEQLARETSRAINSALFSVDSSVDDLLAAVARGDREAFALVYRRFLDPVSRVAQLLMRNATLAEEVTQEVFLAVWLGASRFDPSRGGGSAWIMGIARSRTIDRIRAVQAARQRDRSYSALQVHSDTPTPDEVAARLDRRMIHEALGVLTPKQRQSVMLAFFGGHSYQEVSALLGIPLPTVKSRIRDALRRLRAHLENTDQLISGGVSARAIRPIRTNVLIVRETNHPFTALGPAPTAPYE